MDVMFLLLIANTIPRLHQGLQCSRSACNVIWILWIKSKKDLILNSPNLHAYQTRAQQQSLFFTIIIVVVVIDVVVLIIIVIIITIVIIIIIIIIVIVFIL